MKTSKLVMIATIFAISMLSFTASMETNANTGTREIHITLEEAVAQPALVQAMYTQLNTTLLGQNDGDYTAFVLYQGFTVYITGSYYEWALFFRMENQLINNAELKS